MSATYGKDGLEVDVTHELTERFALGQLRIRASNDIAGDPNVGVVKDLVVVYEVGGRRYRCSVREGEWLLLP